MGFDLVAHGSLVLIFAWLVVGGLGVPLPEDVALLAAGALVYHGHVAAALAVPVVFAGVLTGDIALFLIARRLGTAAYDRPSVRKLLPPARRAKLEEAYRKHGGGLIFAARHLVGLRAAVFAFAGIHGVPLRKFVAWDALAACVSVPLTVTLGYFGALHIDRVRSDVAAVERWVLLAIAIIAIVLVIVRKLRCSHYDHSRA